MGYLTEKYSRIIKAPYYLYFKEAIEIRKLVLGVRRLYTAIYLELPKKVEKEHKIREALNLLHKEICKTAKDSMKVDKKISINIIVQEDKALDIIQRIEDTWEKIIKDIRRTKRKEIRNELKSINDQFVFLIRNTMLEAEKKDKGAYNDVMNIIKASEKGDKTFMANMKTMFKTMDPSRLGRWAEKMEAKGVRNYIVALGGDSKKIRALVTELNADLRVIEGRKVRKKEDKLKRERDFHDVVKKLGVLLKGMKGHIANEFLEAYKVLKRDFTLIFILLNQLDYLRNYLIERVKMKELPARPVQENLEIMQEIEGEAAKHARTIAQGLRIVFHREKKLARF